MNPVTNLSGLAGQLGLGDMNIECKNILITAHKNNSYRIIFCRGFVTG